MSEPAEHLTPYTFTEPYMSNSATRTYFKRYRSTPSLPYNVPFGPTILTGGEMALIHLRNHYTRRHKRSK